MHTDLYVVDTQRFARCIRAGARVRWDLERDAIRRRVFDPRHKFLPDGLSLIAALDFLTPDEARLPSWIQGRTYAGMFGLVERLINAEVLEVSRDHWFGDQIALEAMVGDDTQARRVPRAFAASD